MTLPRPELEWRVSGDLVPYPESLKEMESRIAAIRTGEAAECVWLLEHPPLYTAGTSAQAADLVDAAGLPVYSAGRGGQYTYHGPGQRIAYVMLDLSKRGRDVRWFVCRLEDWLIDVISAFGVKGERRPGRVGVWVDRGGGREDKIAAIGVRVRHWVTFHGVSLNLNPNLDHYRGIIPCGIREQGVTSLADLGLSITMDDLDRELRQRFAAHFSDQSSCVA